MTSKFQPNPSTFTPAEAGIDHNKAAFAAARSHLEDGLQALPEDDSSSLWRLALPFACGALVSGVALWFLKGRKARSFALVQFVTQPPPKPPAGPGLVSAAWDAGARVVLPQLIQLLTQKHNTDEDHRVSGPPVAH